MELSTARSLTTLWASLMSDGEVLMTNFLASGHWDYKTFASIMQNLYATAVFHTAVGKGKNRDQHSLKVIRLILNTAKSFWLTPTSDLREDLRSALRANCNNFMPFSVAVGMTGEHASSLREGYKAECFGERQVVVLKKRLGGFYWLYTLFFKQPSLGSILIPMEKKDWEGLEAFEDHLKTVVDEKLWNTYRFMLNRMKINSAFELTVADERHDIDHQTRFLLNTKRDSHLELLKTCKQLEDELCHDQKLRAVESMMIDYLKSKKDLAEASESVEMSGTEEEENGGKGLIKSLRESTPTIVHQLVQVVGNLKSMGDVPTLSRCSILGNATTERLLMNETCKRKTRLENKEKKTTVAQRYDRDIFGSKKVAIPSGERTAGRRGRSQAATNLWSHYIPEQFDFTLTAEGDGDEDHAAKEAAKQKKSPKEAAQGRKKKKVSPKKVNAKASNTAEAAPDLPKGNKGGRRNSAPKNRKTSTVTSVAEKKSEVPMNKGKN